MPLRTKNLSPWRQAALLLAGSGLLALGLAWGHPARQSVAELASIPTLPPGALARLGHPVISVTPAVSGTAGDGLEIPFTAENFDAQVENVSAQYHGREWIVVRCPSPGCAEGWALAKRLRRYGFPHVALLAQEERP